MQALHARGGQLAALLAEEDAAALDAEAAELEVELAAAPDERTAELLEQSRQALAYRREAVAELAASHARIQAQLRALGHQLRSARLAIAGREPDAAADLSGVLDGLAQQSRSAQELEDTLARARRARVR